MLEVEYVYRDHDVFTRGGGDKGRGGGGGGGGGGCGARAADSSVLAVAEVLWTAVISSGNSIAVPVEAASAVVALQYQLPSTNQRRLLLQLLL